MRQVGYTLVELSVVVLIVAVVAAAVIGSQTSVDKEQALDAAAEEVAAAFRFARSEAIRTGEPHGVIGNTGSQHVQVYRLNAGVPEYTVRHPVDKKLYDLNFAADPMLERVTVTSAVFWYEDVASPQSFVGFNPDGTPKFFSAGTVRMLAGGALTLAADGATRSISVAPMTGRVSVQ